MDDRTDLLQGTLALMILRTLETLGPQHGFGIARRIEQVSDGTLQLNHGTVYPALVRLEQEGSIKAKWGTSENKPAGQILRDHATRVEADCDRDQPLEPHCRCGGTIRQASG